MLLYFATLESCRMSRDSVSMSIVETPKTPNEVSVCVLSGTILVREELGTILVFKRSRLSRLCSVSVHRPIGCMVIGRCDVS